MVKESYEFDLNANTDAALRKVSELDDAIKGLGSGHTGLDDTLSKYRELIDLQSKLAGGSPSASRDVGGLGNALSSARDLENALSSIQDKLNSIGSRGGLGGLGSGQSPLGSGGGGTSSVSQARKDLNAQASALDDVVAKTRDYRRELSEINRILADQRGLSSRAISTSNMTFEANQRFSSNRSTFGNVYDRGMSGANAELAGAQRSRTLAIQNKNMAREGIGDFADTPLSERKELVKKYAVEEDNLDREIKVQLQYIDSLKNAKEKMDTMSSTLSNNMGNIDIMPQRGTAAYYRRTRAASNAARAVGATANTFSSAYSQGNSINLATGDQALQFSNLSNRSGSTAIRNGIIDNVTNSGLGFGIQDSQNYYAMATSGAGFNGDNQNSLSMMRAYEQGARSSGASTEQYNAFMQSATQGTGTDGIFSTSDIDKLTKAIAGENVRSGNAGNPNQNLQTVTTVLNQIMNTRALSTNQELTATATTGMFSQMGRDFQGQAGQNFATSIQSGFTSASQGNNSQLALMKVMSDPNKYGGVAGYQRAQESLELGVADPSNISMLRNYTNNLSASGSGGTAIAAQLVKQLFPGVGAKESREFVQHMQAGYSTSDLQKEIEKDQKAGKETASKNYDSYMKDYQSSLKDINQKLEGINSKISSGFVGRTVTSLRNATQSADHPYLSTGITALSTYGGIRLLQGASHGLASVFSGSKLSSLLPNSLKSLFSGVTEGGSAVAEGAEAVEGATPMLSKVLPFMSKASPILSKVATPLAVASSAFDIATSKNKGKAVARNVGGLGGMAGGAAIGSLIMPGIGTAIGGAIGYFGGSWAGNKVGDALSPDKKSKKVTSVSELAAQQAAANLKKEQDIVSDRLKYAKEDTDNLKKEEALNKASGPNATSSHHAFGGYTNTETWVGEGGKGEVIIPTDPAKRNRAQSLVNMVGDMTGLSRQSVASSPSGSKSTVISPTININMNGSSATEEDGRKAGSAAADAILKMLSQSQEVFSNQWTTE